MQLAGVHRRNRPAAGRTLLAFEEVLELGGHRRVVRIVLRVRGLHFDRRTVRRSEPPKREEHACTDDRCGPKEGDDERHCIHAKPPEFVKGPDSLPAFTAGGYAEMKTDTLQLLRLAAVSVRGARGNAGAA